MDRFIELTTFVAVAEQGGFHAGARALGKSPPTVTRLVKGLEERLGTRLFTRTTRQIALTEAGTRLLADARRILEDLDAAEGSAAGAHREPQGTLSVTAPTIFGRVCVAPVLRSYIDLNPKVAVRAVFVDRVVNLIEEGLDVAVRIGDLPDSVLTAIRVGAVRRVVVASPAYLERHGRPLRLEDLAHHRLAVPGELSGAETWVFVRDGEKRAVPVRAALGSNVIDVSIDAARAGWGITRALSYQVASDLGTGALVEILSDCEDRVMPVHLLHAEGVLRAAKIRAFLDHASHALRRQAAGWVGA